MKLGVDGGLNAIERQMIRMHKDARKDARNAIAVTGLELRSGIIKRYQKGPKTGRKYRRGNVVHQASAPGESPATDRGALVSSVFSRELVGLAVEVGSRLDYAYYLEYGTRRNGRTHIEPRPAWEPEIKAIEPKFEKRMRAVFERHFR